MADADEVRIRRKRPPRPRSDLPNTPDAVDIAMHAAVSGKPLPDVARRLLEEQSELIHAQCAELHLRAMGQRVRAALWAILAIAACAILGLIGLLLVHAARADALIVQSFQVPPSLAAQGLSGQVVATEVLDKLADMQGQSESMRAASSYDNNWGDDLKIDIPNTGATADQLWKLLRGWLGKETRISGEIIRTPEGLALTARAGSKPGQRFVSKSGNLDELVTKAAELIYRETQPYRYSVYLAQFPERAGEQHALLIGLTRDASPRERKWALNGLAVDAREQGNFRGALGFAHRALAIDPKMQPAFANLVVANAELGHDQEAIDTLARQHALPVGSEYDADIVAGNLCNQDAIAADAERDPVLLDRAADCFDASANSFAGLAGAARVYAGVLRHDWRPALSFVQPVTGGLVPGEAAAATVRSRLVGELERGSLPGIAEALDAFRAEEAVKLQVKGSEAYYQARVPIGDWPLEARALARLGRLDEAAALIAKTPLDCYNCVRVRGLVEEARGNAPAAQRWFAEAARQGPRLAPAFADWGRLLAEARHYDSAEVKLSRAVQLAPNWADPLKYWGDLLAAQGRTREALAKYDAALKLAPNWAELRGARASVQQRERVQ
jgi:tetratricopeptide (TPR) repeat protein